MVAAPVPDAGRVPHLRQRLHHDRRRERHRDGLAAGLPPDHQPGRDRPRLGGLGAAVPVRGADLRRSSSSCSRSTCPRREGSDRWNRHLSTRAKRGSGSSRSSIILLRAVPGRSGSSRCRSSRRSDLTNGKFLPTALVAGSNYQQILTGGAKDLFLSALRNSIGICADRDVHRGRAGHVRGLRDRPARLPGQEADPDHRAGGVDLPGDLDRHAAVQPVARRSACTTPGSA